MRVAPCNASGYGDHLQTACPLCWWSDKPSMPVRSLPEHTQAASKILCFFVAAAVGPVVLCCWVWLFWFCFDMNPVRADMGLGTAGAHVSRLHPRRERRTSTLVRGMQCQRCAAIDPGACCEASGRASTWTVVEGVMVVGGWVAVVAGVTWACRCSRWSCCSWE